MCDERGTRLEEKGLDRPGFHPTRRVLFPCKAREIMVKRQWSRVTQQHERFEDSIALSGFFRASNGKRLA